MTNTVSAQESTTVTEHLLNTNITRKEDGLMRLRLKISGDRLIRTLPMILMQLEISTGMKMTVLTL